MQYSGIIKQCTYKSEKYSVRDNGEILRFPPEGKRARPLDNQWTLGRLNVKTGYLDISNERVHRIVAYAFHGIPPTKEHVVDHIDTNRQNNRPENLRWVTKLENIILNPITVKRIIYVCGSVEAFLENPSAFTDKFTEPNLSWMCHVSKEEAQISRDRLLAWSKSENKPSNGTLGDWIFKRVGTQNDIIIEDSKIVDNIIKSLSLNAIQRNWFVPSEFPCCPNLINKDPITQYLENLKIDSVFCINQQYSSLVYKVAINKEENSIIVLTKSADEHPMKPWALAKVTFENNLYVHESIRTFFSIEGAEKGYTLSLNLVWEGGDSIDDYC